MNLVWTIARTTATEARRNKVAWSILFFCIVLLLTSFLFQEVTIFDTARVLRDVGLATIHVFTVLLAIFMGVTAVTREIERKTVYYILSKPIGRRSYLTGKLLGIWLAIAATGALMFGAFAIENAVFHGELGLVVVQAFWLILVEALVIASFAILLSTFSSTMLSAFTAAGLFLIGHLSSDLYYFSSKSASAFVRGVGAAMFYALPNLERLNLKNQAAMLEPVPLSDTLLATGYGLVFVVVFMSLAFAIFSRRDLK